MCLNEMSRKQIGGEIVLPPSVCGDRIACQFIANVDNFAITGALLA